ncbi:MAG: peptidoglycan-binding domain-containing protein [Solirubrobacteraceae bacterium]
MLARSRFARIATTRVGVGLLVVAIAVLLGGCGSSSMSGVSGGRSVGGTSSSRLAAHPTPAATAPTRPRGVPSARRRAPPMLRLGSHGPAVRALQSTLARLTYLPRSAVDGSFGTQTWHAVVAFQG